MLKLILLFREQKQYESERTTQGINQARQTDE